jgi:hypothetical protein
VLPLSDAPRMFSPSSGSTDATAGSGITGRKVYWVTCYCLIMLSAARCRQE